MIEKLDNQGKDITRSNAHVYAEARVNKVQEAIRSALMRTGKANNVPGATPTAIIAEGAALLYEQAVINGQRTTITDKDGDRLTTGEAMRDRLAVLKEVATQAGEWGAERAAPAPQSVTNVLVLDSDRAQRIARMLAQADAVDAEVAE
jgi:hypothetical protein